MRVPNNAKSVAVKPPTPPASQDVFERVPDATKRTQLQCTSNGLQNQSHTLSPSCSGICRLSLTYAMGVPISILANVCRSLSHQRGSATCAPTKETNDLGRTPYAKVGQLQSTQISPRVADHRLRHSAWRHTIARIQCRMHLLPDSKR